MTPPELAQMVKKLDGVLREHAVSGAVSATSLAGWVTTMATVLYAYKRTGDSQMKTHNERIHKEALAAINKELQAAEILINSEFLDQETKGRIGDFWREANDRKSASESHKQRACALVDLVKGKKNVMPKATRHDLCIFIIAVWKAIKNTDEIPGREGERNSKNSEALAAEFSLFLGGVLAPLEDYDTSVGELHKQILLLERLEQESKQPKTSGADEKKQKNKPAEPESDPYPKWLRGGF